MPRSVAEALGGDVFSGFQWDSPLSVTGSTLVESWTLT